LNGLMIAVTSFMNAPVITSLDNILVDAEFMPCKACPYLYVFMNIIDFRKPRPVQTKCTHRVGALRRCMDWSIISAQCTEATQQGKNMSYAFYDVIGNAGVILIIGSYFLIQIGKLSATGVTYSVVNLLGAAFILYSLIFEFNMSAFLVEIFWMLISLVGLGRIYLRRRQRPAQA